MLVLPIRAGGRAGGLPGSNNIYRWPSGLFVKKEAELVGRRKKDAHHLDFGAQSWGQIC